MMTRPPSPPRMAAPRVESTPKHEGIAVPVQDHHRRVLQSLRRIMRRVEMSSRLLEGDYGVTAPQLVCLTAVVDAEVITQVELSERIHLSPSTLVGVLDRLQAKGLVVRARDGEDRRRILVRATDAGRHLVRQAPPPLQETLLRGMGSLSNLELLAMASSLDRLVDLLEAGGVADAPMLAAGPIPKPEP